jgi:predicted NBD/HSP70 family sugar kinase
MQYLRDSNRTSILKQLVIGGNVSRIELSHKMGLTKMAITNIVKKMILENLIEEVGTNRGRDTDKSTTNGRKRMALKIPDYRINALGLFIERYHIHCIAMDINKNILGYNDEALPHHIGNDQFVGIILKFLRAFIQKYINHQFIGLGVSSIGPVDIQTRTILRPTNFGEINNVKIGDILEREFNIPTYIANCMSAGVLAEYLYGKARDTRNIAYLGLGTGVGAGIIIQGKVLSGNAGFAGEIGHMSVNFNGPKCSCGQKGCLEVYVSVLSLLRDTGLESIDQIVSEVTKINVASSLRRKVKQYLNATLSALVAIANNFDPEIIFMGDKGSLLTRLYLDDLEKQMNILMIQRSRKIPLLISSFEEKTPLIGAPAIIFDKIFSRELNL